MKRRNRVLLLGMLTGIWLCVQSPFAHAQRLQFAAATGEPAAQAVAEVEDAPCHGDHHPVPETHSGADADAHASSGAATGTDCCDGDHCDGLCAQLSWALAAPTAQRVVRSMAWLIPLEAVGLQRVHQPEPFRPPI